MPINVASTAKGLKLKFDEFDYTQPKPQSAAYLKWLKAHLVAGHPIVWFPICKVIPSRGPIRVEDRTSKAGTYYSTWNE